MLRLNILKMGLVPRLGHLFNHLRVHHLKTQCHVMPCRNLKFLKQREPLPNGSRRYIHDIIDTDSEDSLDPTEMTNFDKSFEGSKQLLYPNSSDELILRLNECSSLSEVHKVINENAHKLNHTHICQSVLVVHDIEKILYDSTNVQTDYSKNPEFMGILNLAAGFVDDLNAEEAACTALELCKLGVKLNSKVLQALLARCEELLERLGVEFPLLALTRYAITISDLGQQGLWNAYSSVPVIPVLLGKLHRCSTADDLELITLCLRSIHCLVGKSILKIYSMRVQELLDSNVITSDDVGVILKTTHFLNYPHWNFFHSGIIKELLLKLKSKVSEMKPRDLIVVNQVVNIQLEPASLMEEIDSCASKLLSEGFDESNSKLNMNSIDLMLCAITFSSPNRHKFFENLAHRSLLNNNFESSMHVLYKVLRYLKSSNTNLYDLFWTKVLRYLEEKRHVMQYYKFLRYCHRYMYFNNNLGGTYRHYDFEKRMIQWLMEEMVAMPNGLVPWNFAKMAAFIIAYSKKSRNSDTLPGIIIDKMRELSPQFSELDCLHLSKGLQIASILRFRNQISSTLAKQLVEIHQILDCCAERQIKDENLDITQINIIMRTCTNRRNHTDTKLFQKIAKRYERKHANLSSRAIRATAYNMQAANFTFVDTVEQMTSYIVENKDHVLGNTVEKILFSCYNLGYSPENADQFLPAANETIFRDRERMSGLTLIQAALALCYYHGLSSEMINYIFSVNFLERLDEEMSHCYSKSTYPMRIRHLLMQLNRAVCLDYPEADVPWFHKKYCEDIIAQAYTESSQFHDDVYCTLKTVIGEDELVQIGTYSPYSYKIDFLLNAEKEVHSKTKRRTAIVLLKDDAFCDGGRHMKGPYKLKKRHLEILGFHVITVTRRTWNSMYMSEPAAKVNYFRDSIDFKAGD